MVFTSVTFLFYFLPIFAAAYCSARSVRAKNIVTLLFSLVFYAWGEPLFILVLLASIAFNMRLAIVIDGRHGDARRRALTFAVASNLGLLGVFKYLGFFIGIINDVLAPLNLHIPALELPLPLGISFFTFHCLSYVIDVYRRRFAANRDPVEIALYIVLFPQLVAGPIVRYKTIARQLRQRRGRLLYAAVGARIFVVGLAQKVLIADQVALLVESVFDHTNHPGAPEAWLGLWAYTLQIYFDFAGYSNMAVGLGLILGFALPRNFRMPYTSRSITDFWRRWHMSLSAWLRDYLYIPLGGNRGTTQQTYRNLFVVFLLCGLWHGANLTFVLWGAWHGLFLVIERSGIGRHLQRTWPPLQWCYSMLVVTLGWVLFRSSNVESALDFYAGLFGWHGSQGLGFELRSKLDLAMTAALIAGSALSVLPWWKNALKLLGAQRAPTDLLWKLNLLAVSMLSVAAGTYSPFLYFRF